MCGAVPAPAIAEAQGHSLPTWRAIYDKRGQLRRTALAAKAFAALPLDPAAEEAALEEPAASSEESDSSDDAEGAGPGGRAPGAAPGGQVAQQQSPVGEGAVEDIPEIRPLGSDLSGGAAGGAASAGQRQLALLPEGAAAVAAAQPPALNLAILGGLWDLPPAQRGRPSKKRALPAGPPAERRFYRLRPGAAWLTAFEASHLQRRGGTLALLAACDGLLEGTQAHPEWDARSTFGAGGPHPNTTGMRNALCGGATAYAACAAPECQACAAAEARAAARGY